jgi:hypothetical protein
MRRPQRFAKTIVAIRDMASVRMVRSRAYVAEELASPTPRPWRRARFASRDVMVEKKAWIESHAWYAR